ncbi:zinc-binding alcohol dehydrogenase family protein [Halomonas sp. I1]|uniref:zinc-binding alcohol dehydrogenase family protein n=1 Tax=Halomonas sp. I1 TaxID=393536 RepID=UPI0028DF7A94|nr:zinc-binding alcohol dehydrogenase family protein [Halomonas sp. I1]MDT8893073.1 zinc-binding alcohol dehydrogenase family protein [Halomonas sp. I1]
MAVSDIPRPECGPGDALVRIRRVGVCGTDIHAFGGQQPYFTYPRVLGHELAGEVATVGEGGDPALIGQNAYVIPYLHCGECHACRRGHTNCCQSMEVVGVHRDGGMADFLVVPIEHLVTSSRLSSEQLALIECLAIGAHAVRRSEIDRDKLAVIAGAGPIGMGILQIARSRGARTVVTDTNPERLAFCRNVLGAERTLRPGEDDVEGELEAMTGGALADVVFDATGNPHAMEAGFNFVGHGGRYVLVSIVKADIRFHDPDFHKKELTLLGSRNATREDFATVTRLMENGELRSDAMITHRGRLEEVPQLMPKWCEPASGVIKAMIILD